MDVQCTQGWWRNLTGSVAIRFDVSPVIGIGHARRAMAFGAELSKRGLSHFYVTSNDAVDTARSLGIPSSKLYGFDENAGESDWIRCHTDVTHVITDFCHSQRSNAGETVRSILQTKAMHIAAVDSMPPHHFEACSDAIPSLAITPYLDAEFLRTRPLCERWLAGARYAVLENAFASIRQSLMQTTLTPGNYILVCCGGSDPAQLSASIVRKILQYGQPEMEIKVVIGSLFDRKLTGALEHLANQSSHRVSLTSGQDGIAKLIANCGFLIGRVGLLRYEAACLGKTTLLVQENSRYENYLRGFEKAGLGQIYLLDQQVDRERFDAMIASLSDRDTIQSYSEPNLTAFDRVDGQGAGRCVDALLEISRKV